MAEDEFAAATPRPWRAYHNAIKGSDGLLVGSTSTERDGYNANAALIVVAVNAYRPASAATPVRSKERDALDVALAAPCSPWWAASLRFLGTCCYRGTIPPAAITRAVAWPHKPNVRLMFVWDPAITLLNQQICGDGYRDLTRRLFAGEFDTVAREHDYNHPILPPITGWRRLPE